MATSDNDAPSAAPTIQPPAPWHRSIIGLTELLLAALRRDAPALDAASRAQAIAFARITLIVGLVILHYGQFPNSATSPYRGMDPVLHPLATYVNSLVLFFLFSVVPLLSMISGYLYLFVRRQPRRQLVDPIKRRFFSLYLPIGVLACWGVILRIAPTSFGRVVSSLGGLAFFLHAVHYPLLAEIKLLLWPLVPAETDSWMLAHYASSTLLTVAIGIGTGILLAHQAPSLFELMNGGRSLRWAAPP